MVQGLSKQQQDYFSQLSPFRHVHNIKLCFSWREKHCFMLIVTIKKGKALQCENEFAHKHTLKIEVLNYTLLHKLTMYRAAFITMIY